MTELETVADWNPRRLVKMRNIIWLIFFAKTCLTFDIPKTTCKSDLTIGKNQYNATKTYDVGFAYPTEAHFDEYGNLFFVSYSRNFFGYHFNIKIIKHNSTVPKDITGLPKGKSYSIALDKTDTKVYFGTSKGIFLYNYEANNATLVSKPDLKLNNMFIDKDGNKYVTDNVNGEEDLYLLTGDKKIRFKSFDALSEMAVDKNNNFYYIREGNFYVLKSNMSRSVLIGNVTYDGIAQISFHKETVYVASKCLAYIHENDTGPLKMVQNVTDIVTAISFDHSGNFVLGSYGKLSKYETQENECYHRSSNYKNFGHENISK